MQKETENTPTKKSFVTYYLPCFFFIAVTALIVISVVLSPETALNLPFLAVLLFSIYRRYVSGWIPEILDRERAFANEKQAWELRRLKDDTERMPHTTGDLRPGFITRIEIWVKSKVLSFVVMFIVWVPMEFFIQAVFLIKAVNANKKDELLPTRRGLWPGEEGRMALAASRGKR